MSEVGIADHERKQGKDSPSIPAKLRILLPAHTWLHHPGRTLPVGCMQQAWLRQLMFLDVLMLLSKAFDKESIACLLKVQDVSGSNCSCHELQA